MRALPLVVLVILASAVRVRAQEPQAPAADVLPATGVDLVRIEVVVKDNRGRPRTGLRREDFAVFEEGEPQEIAQFQAFTRPGQPGAPPSPAGISPGGAAEGAPPLPARYVVLAIDDVHMEFVSLVRVRKALEGFIEDDLRPEDRVALVTTSGALRSRRSSPPTARSCARRCRGCRCRAGRSTGPTCTSASTRPR